MWRRTLVELTGCLAEDREAPQQYFATITVLVQVGSGGVSGQFDDAFCCVNDLDD